MPVVRMPDGALVNFPDTMPREEIKGLIASKFPDIATAPTTPAPIPSLATPPTPSTNRPLPDARERSFTREALDVPIQLGKGVVTGTRFLTDVFGADNPVSRTLSGVEDTLDSLLSAQSKRDQEEIARIMEEAENKGMGAQVMAGLQALTVAPVDLIANAFGTSGPTLVAGVLGSVAGLPALGVATGVGVLTGVGITKDAAYDAVFQELVDAGVPEGQAKEAAQEAQAYGGENLDNIAFGGFLGALAARVGLEPKILTRAVGQRLAGDVSETGLKNATKAGIIKEASRTALKEALPEALQGGQEQFTRNVALQREGFDVPTFRGVTGAATLEGAVGAPVGAISSVGSDAIKPRGTRLAEVEERLATLAEEQTKTAQEEETEREKRKATQAEIDEFLKPYEESIQEEEKQASRVKAAIAAELEVDIDSRKVEQEYQRRVREAEDRASGEFADPERYAGEQRLRAAEEQIKLGARPDASPRDQAYVEDVLDGMRGPELQQLAERTLTSDGINFVEGRRQAEEDALAGRLGPETQKRAEERRKELEPQEEADFEIIDEFALSADQRAAMNKFFKELETKPDKDKRSYLKTASTERGVDSLDNVLNFKLTKDQKREFRRKHAAIQEEEGQATTTHDKAVRNALAKGEYEPRKDYVYPSGRKQTGKKKKSNFIKFVEAEQKAIAKGIPLSEAVKKEFPNVPVETLEAITTARAGMRKAQEKIFTLGARGIATGKRAEADDPVKPIQELATEESIIETIQGELKSFDANEENSLAALKDVRKEKPSGKKAIAAGKYFKLPVAKDTPKAGLYEIAYDLATNPDSMVEDLQPTTIKEDIDANPPSPPLPSAGIQGRIPEKNLNDAIKNFDVGLKRGTITRTDLKAEDVQNAASWVYFDSELSPEVKEEFARLVARFRKEYREDIINAARSEQLADKKEAREEQIKKDRKAEEEETEQRRLETDEIVAKLKEALGRRVRRGGIEVLAVRELGYSIEEVVDELQGGTALADVVAEAEEDTSADIEELERQVEGVLTAAEEDVLKQQAIEHANKVMTERYKDKSLVDYPSDRAKEWDIEFIKERKTLQELVLAEKKAQIEKARIEQERLDAEATEERLENLEQAQKEFVEKGGQATVLPYFDKFIEGKLEKPYTATASSRSRKAFPDTSVDPVIAEAARTGNLNQTIKAIIDSEPKEIRPIIRKLREMATGVKIRLESFSDPEETGRYYYDEKVIALDPERGLNKETVFHELSHAALDKILANRESKEVKQLFNYYETIKTQMGDAYGGTDLYEFVAELVGNSEFQNLLKEIKAPKSKSLWDTIVETILNFLGIRKGQSAYDKSLKFLNDILTARPSIEPSSAESVFLGNKNPDVAFKEELAKFPPYRARRLKEAMENIKGPEAGKLKGILSGAARLDNLFDLYKKELPGIKEIIDNTEMRQADQERRIEAVNKKYNDFHIIAHKFKAAYEAMGKMAMEMRLARVDIFKPPPNPNASNITSDKAKAKVEEQLKAYNKGKAAFERIGKMEGGKSVQNMYKIMRTDFDKMYNDYIDVVLSSISNPQLRQEIEKKFDEAPPIAGYIPSRRYGEFVLVYKDKDTGKKTVVAFESQSKRNEEIKARGLTKRFDIQADLEKATTEEEKEALRKRKRDADLNKNEYFTVNSIQDLARKTLPPEGFVADAMQAVKDSAKDLGLDDKQGDILATDVYEAYVDLFPESSVMQSFRSSEDVLGPSEDVLRVYGDTMVKWSRKLADIEYNGKIQQGFNRVRSQAADYGNRKQRSPSDPTELTIQSVAKNISSREDFTLNPTYGLIASKATSGSYFMYMAGNISSALVNLSSVPLMSYPILAGRFGTVKAAAALKTAGGVAINSDWGSDPKYQTLYKTLSDHAQLRHTLEREVLEGARQTTEQYRTGTAKLLSFLSKPISATERYNRATTGVMAYDLARADGMSEQDAANYALKIVKDVNTSGMATTAPKWMQNDIGRVMLTFKGFIWQSTYVTGRAFYESVKGQDAKTKKAALKQLALMYGMSYAIGGMYGLPLFGLTATLINMVARIFDVFDDEEDAPFNTRQALQEMGLSELILKGPTNSFLNIEVSGRASIANGIGFREDPYEIEKFGYMNSMILQMLGPMGSYVADAPENLGLALNEIIEGDLDRGFERLSPSFLRNGIKTMRFLEEGARTKDGRPIVQDLNAYNLYMQAFGFTPANVSFTYETRALAKQYENRVMRKRSELLQARYLAVTTGDRELRRRTDERITNFRRLYPRLITGDTLIRSYKARRAAEREYIAGIRFNRNFRQNLDPLFRSLSDVNYYGGIS